MTHQAQIKPAADGGWSWRILRFSNGKAYPDESGWESSRRKAKRAAKRAFRAMTAEWEVVA